jgi:hypothetical protein
MNNRTPAALAALALSAVLGACPAPPAGAGPLAPEVVGAWYAGAGGVSQPYDPRTGSWGTPDGMGLVYDLRADGTYTRAFQSYHSNGGCTNGFTVFEQGAYRADPGEIRTSPASGRMRVSDTCSPSLDSDRPLGAGDLHPERMAWALVRDGAETRLRLSGADGAASDFRRL